MVIFVFLTTSILLFESLVGTSKNSNHTHIQCTFDLFPIADIMSMYLSEEGLRVGWHVPQVVHHDEHLDDGAKGVEECQLDGAGLRHPVPLLPKVDVALTKLAEVKTKVWN